MSGRVRGILVMLWVMGYAGALSAQNTERRDVPRADTVTGEPSLAKIATGALIGGAAGAGLAALLTLPVAGTDEGIGVFVGLLAISVPTGVTLATRKAATFPGRESPNGGKILLGTLLGLAAGGLVMGTIGNSFDSPGSSNAWYVGITAGLLTDLWITSAIARRVGRKAPAKR